MNEEDINNTLMVFYLFIANIILFSIIIVCSKLIMKINNLVSNFGKSQVRFCKLLFRESLPMPRIMMAISAGLK